MEEEISALFSYLSSKKKIERDKGVAIIQELLKDPKDGTIEALEKSIRELLCEDAWESRHGALMATEALLQKDVATESLSMEVQAALSQLLEDTEPRVRLAAGKCEVRVTDNESNR